MNDTRKLTVVLTMEQAAAVVALIQQWRKEAKVFPLPITRDLAQAEMAIMRAEDLRVKA
jgi:hypothetical protein